MPFKLSVGFSGYAWLTNATITCARLTITNTCAFRPHVLVDAVPLRTTFLTGCDLLVISFRLRYLLLPFHYNAILFACIAAACRAYAGSYVVDR